MNPGHKHEGVAQALAEMVRLADLGEPTEREMALMCMACAVGFSIRNDMDADTPAAREFAYGVLADTAGKHAFRAVAAASISNHLKELH